MRVVVVPPFDSSPSADDGVRMLSSGEGVSALTDCMRRILELERISHHTLSAASVEGRVKEVLDWLG